ncbi:uncharacterized protein LTHEOB_4097 [Lasiodiplodia theobromae]|uniref:uncharacterized protein n=1 Tax=Lasiodiplodia theobromae TaxID=45133 RepID=UPI0015C2F6D1|nr:uncharacterized protein LTHEOB_4097 [Lasiodiplodia theobromae]KAF4546789.1 hypothetical protein LTHEOB_4097 [Lasiodiplodia theobromae]
MTTEQAIAILSSVWSPNVRMWKYKGCQFGDDPHLWPPGILSALAALAQTAGPNYRVRAMQIVAAVMGRTVTASTEHIVKATELLRAEKMRPPQVQPVRGSAMANYNQSPADQKEKEVADLREEVKTAKKAAQEQLMEKQKQIDAMEMKWFDMDATLSVVATDRDMFKMYWEVAEIYKTRLERENSELKQALQEKDAYITEAVRERDQAIGRVEELERELMGICKTGGDA